jgi:GH25 family lysozyme M1 (1,4-beta-N-acetylmuramidase)
VRSRLKTALSVIAWCWAAHFVAQSQAAGDSFEGVCQNGPAKGAQVEDEKYCGFFRNYENNPNKPLDTRIADALHIKSSRETRAIGLVIAISHYPHMPDSDLPAAKVDGERMVNFLVNTQQFDEVIALTDENATYDAIRYFLQQYLPGRAEEFNGKARLLIAYSGHGRFGGDQKPALILSAAKKMADVSSGVYDMEQFYSDIQALAGTNTSESRARSAFHVITLVNACFGGEIFTNGKPGGNADDFPNPGSYAITAGDDKHEVPSLIQDRGSLFFDLVIEGVTSGYADLQYWDAYKTVDSSGTPSDPHGLTRSLALVDFLTGNYAKIVRDRSHSAEPLILSAPWFGPAQSDVARGGFFFLSDRAAKPPPSVADIYKPKPSIVTAEVHQPDAATPQVSFFGEKAPKTAPLTLPTGPISALPGRPDMIVFKAPEVYPIRGYDISSADGAIDWGAFRESVHPRFIYARAVGWSGPDPSFEKRWQGARTIGADYGAYAKFDFCLSPKDQLERLLRIVPKDDKALPVAIELVHPLGESQQQLRCLQAAGLEAEKSAIIQLASDVREAYGKIPVLSGNRYNLSQLTDERSDPFMIWMGSYRIQNVRLRGRNPWTLWQYAGDLNVPGIGPNTTGDAFFGTEDQYHAFKIGEVNVAKAAVTEAQDRQ